MDLDHIFNIAAIGCVAHEAFHLLLIIGAIFAGLLLRFRKKGGKKS